MRWRVKEAALGAINVFLCTGATGEREPQKGPASSPKQAFACKEDGEEEATRSTKETRTTPNAGRGTGLLRLQAEERARNRTLEEAGER